jgi:hypothetical protein
MKKNLKNILKDLEKLDWENIEEVYKRSREALRYIFDDRRILSQLISSMLKNKELLSLAEHYDFFDKLVLYVDKKDRFRLRLHIFSGEISNKERPHCHRWTYSSVILNGGYQHFIYGAENEIINKDISEIKPVIIKEEKVGSIYAIKHNIFHSIAAKENTISFIIRGPAVKERFLIVDKKVNKKWWEYGRESETIEEIKSKSVNQDKINGIIAKLNKARVLN